MIKIDNKRLRVIAAAVTAVAAWLMTSGLSHAAVYDVVSGFNTTGTQPAAGNPWSYGTETAVGGTFTFLPNYTAGAVLGTCATPTCSYNEYYFGSLNSVNDVALNTSGSTTTRVGNPPLVWPATELQISPGGPEVVNSPDYTVVRWTAPSSGVYDISGLFQNLQTSADNFNILVNGVSNFNASFDRSEALGAQLPFSLNGIALLGGDTIDFVVGNNLFSITDNNNADGLSATITTAPEPTSVLLLLVGLSLVAAAGISRRRRRTFFSELHRVYATIGLPANLAPHVSPVTSPVGH